MKKTIDNLFADAGRLIIEQKRASIGLLQRRLKVGFNRASEIMQQLEEAAVVSEADEMRSRSVLMELGEFEKLLRGGRFGVVVYPEDKAADAENKLLGIMPEPDDFSNDWLFHKYRVHPDYDRDSLLKAIDQLDNVLVPEATMGALGQIIIKGIVENCNPNTYRVVMIDPKGFNVIGYDEIPHLLFTPVTEENRLSAALNWLDRTVQNRKKDAQEREIINGEPLLPQILVIIPELEMLQQIFKNDGEMSDTFTRILINGPRLGVRVIAMTRMAAKGHYLGNKRSLFETYSENDFLSLLREG